MQSGSSFQMQGSKVKLQTLLNPTHKFIVPERREPFQGVFALVRLLLSSALLSGNSTPLDAARKALHHAGPERAAQHCAASSPTRARRVEFVRRAPPCRVASSRAA